MAKNNTNAAIAVTDNEALSASLDIPALVEVEIKSEAPKLPGNMFAIVASDGAKLIADKMTKLSTAKQSLAEACDLFAQGKAKNSEASEVANRGAFPLYMGRTSGLFSNAEISAALGDVFGFKPKKDGTPGKTPAGEGEALRKRIVRAVDAYEYVSLAVASKFFDGLPPDEINQILIEIDNGNCSLFTAYDRFGDIKKEHTTKTEQAFNAKHIVSICESLAKPEAVSIIKNNPELLAAYAALSDIIQAIGEAGAKPE